MKLFGIAVEPVASVGVLSAAWVQAVVVLMEILLGVWLLSDGGRGPWLASLVTFGVFACVAFYTAWIGQASCNCFGPMKVNPWYAFALDVGVVTALLVFRPAKNQPRSGESSFRTAGIYAGGVLATLLVVVAGAHLTFGSVGAALAYGRGEQVAVSPGVVDVGVGVVGETRTGEVRFTNHTARPVKIVGATRDCSCAVLGSLPLELAPGETGALTVELSLPEKQGVFTRPAGVLVDIDGLRAKKFRITGRAVARSAE